MDVTPVSVWAAWCVAINLATFVVYALDKSAAREGGRRGTRRPRRVPEATLHTMALLGGVVGGWLGRHVLRHKTRKVAFAVVLGIATVVHVGIGVLVLAR